MNKQTNKQTNEQTNKQTKEREIFGISTTERSEVTYVRMIYDRSEDNINLLKPRTYVGETKEGTNERS